MVRSATTGDLNEVASWITTRRDAELWAGWRVAFPIAIESLPEQIEFSDANAFCLIERSRLVAFGQLVEKPDGRGHMARIIVSPAARQRGHGESFVRALLGVARSRSFGRVSLNVDASNVAAVALYLKLGFADAPRPVDEPTAEGVRYLERSSA